ncbi:MAG: GHMP kinase [Solirubrobacterales bacterium]
MSGAREATGRAFARAALLGNPSDGFGGKTIAMIVRDFAAEVRVREAAQPRVDAEAGARELIEAAITRFGRRHRRPPPLAVALATSIPREVGLGGSSAIVIATLRALCERHGLELEPAALAELALEVETEELGIPGGPQDRVVQAYEGLVYMDFGDRSAGPRYERLDPAVLPPLFVAHTASAPRSSGEVHGDLRRRFERGDPRVVEALTEVAALAEAGRGCLLDGDHDRLGELMAANVAARARMIELDPRHLRLIEIARSLGAPANYAGSGGAIVGIVPDGPRADELRDAFATAGCELVFTS